MGLRVIVDDMLKPTINDGGADQYPVYLMGMVQLLKVFSVLFTESDRNILSKQDVLSWTHDYGFHVFGTSWKNANDNPTNTLLKTAANWECVYGATGTGNAGNGQKLVPVVKLLVNSPLAANV